MEQSKRVGVKTLFDSLPEDSQKLLIAMSTVSHEFGLSGDEISAISAMGSELIGPAMAVLTANNLVKSENGDTYGLSLEVRESILRDVLQFSEDVVSQHLKL